jgi:PadR family transcriptional regulator AphA
MHLRPTSYLLLGMLRVGAASGYAIKKTIEQSTQFFCPTSPAQVYPELDRLEEAGLVARRDASRGARRRSDFTLTADGREALRRWLKSSREEPMQIRMSGMLRLFLADALDPEEQRELVQRLAQRSRDGASHLRTEILPVAERLADRGPRFPHVAAQFGADMWQFAAEWLERLDAEIAARGPVEDGADGNDAAW